MMDSTRRRFVALGTGTLLGTTIFSGFSAPSGEVSATSRGQVGSLRESMEEEEFSNAVGEGLDYFSKRAETQVSLAESLLSAIESGDYETARTAYVEARPPYEEIEVLAGSFGETDTAIDARPTSFDRGETSDEFRGFHRIERLLYRDNAIEAAVPYAEGLIESTKQLRNDLEQRERFGPKSHFAGMIGLAQEVPTKKITSEEETFSDQSLLIFKQNWHGIYSQFKPFADAVASHDEAVAEEVTDSYEAAMAVIDPYFCSKRVAADPYSDLGNDTRGDIVHASYRFRDALIDAADVLNLG